MHGKGILIETDGTIYEGIQKLNCFIGDFEKGKKEGKGILKFPNNS